MGDYERKVLDLFGLAEWDEELVNRRAHELFEELDAETDIRKCITRMKETYTECGYIDRTFAFYLLLSKDHFDMMKRCIDEVKATGALSDQTFAEFCLKVK